MSGLSGFELTGSISGASLITNVQQHTNTNVLTCQPEVNSERVQLKTFYLDFRDK
jgi:hypothetical protein